MFTVSKGGMIYTVQEFTHHWTVSATVGKLKVNYKIDKELCATRDDLESYIKNESTFTGGNDNE